MKKTELLSALERLHLQVEEDQELYCIAALDLLLDYINDSHIREAIERNS